MIGPSVAMLSGALAILVSLTIRVDDQPTFLSD